MKSDMFVPTVNGIACIDSANLESAERLLLLSAMPETYSAYADSRLTSLNPQKDGCNIVSSGRVGKKCLSRLLGIQYLPILMPKSRAAYLYIVY